ncbi:hypothetical protein [Lactococcus fujiensis]|uniref:hypothetical protein n=1 Tax=Lactococcus fujiensis TaxID=610251 RepID=UPI0006CF4D6D|nr:hypothetical protein [Lactococcus fujiensis]
MVTRQPMKWMGRIDVINSFLNWAEKAGFELTKDQYIDWLNWNLQQDDFNMHPTKFIADTTKLSYREVSKRLHRYDDLERQKNKGA